MKARIWFLREYLRFRSLSRNDQRFSVKWSDRHRLDNRGVADYPWAYIYHLAWAARKLKELRPQRHVDISSLIHFPAIISAFMPVEWYEYTPPQMKLEGLQVGQADLNGLVFPTGSISSLSCMHVVEHCGLGRYGDPLDPVADLQAMRELTRVLAPGGTLLFVVPVGRSRIEFNAHRIYSKRQVLDSLPDLQLVEFALIPDNSEKIGLIADAPDAVVDAQHEGCGCFHFIKPDAPITSADRRELPVP